MKRNAINHFISTVLLILTAHFSYGQYHISGTVKNDAGESIPLASIRLSQRNEGTKTDTAGFFDLTTSAKEKVVLTVTSVGYKLFKKELIPGDSTAHLDIVLLSNINTLGAVTISAGSFEASDKAKGASLTAIDALTVAGSNMDIALSLRSLPGAQQIGEQEGLFVRGGTGAETKQYIDGTLLKSPNYPGVPGIQQGARVSPLLFSGILFSTGGYSALYGQAMSSALILESIDMPPKSSAYFAAYLSSIGGGLQKLAHDGRSSYGFNFHYTDQAFYNGLVPQQPSYFAGPKYLQGDGNFRIKSGKAGMLKFYTNWSSSEVGMLNPDIDSASLRSSYQVKGVSSYNNLSYRNLLSENWKVDIGMAYSYNEVNTLYKVLNQQSQPVILTAEPLMYSNSQSDIKSDFAQARIVFTRFLSRNQAIRFGAEHFYSRDHGMSNDSTIALTDNLTAAFAEGDIYLSDNLAVKAGLRLENSSVLHQLVVAPRASLAYRLNGNGQFNLAYGIFYQEPENDLLYHTSGLSFSKATHYILNYTRKANNRFFRVEAYYKRYDDLVKIGQVTNNSGNGYAKGAELFFRDKRSVKNLDYWITYTYLDTKRDYLYYPYELRPSFTSPHTATVAIKKSFPDINSYVNISYAFATGRPYYDFLYNPQGNNTRIADQGVTKPYSIVNLQIAHLTSLFSNWKDKPISGFSIGVNNLLGTNQVFGYNYSYNGNNKMPINLPARRYFSVGIFFNFGIDRTQEVLDNNL